MKKTLALTFLLLTALAPFASAEVRPLPWPLVRLGGDLDGLGGRAGSPQGGVEFVLDEPDAVACDDLRRANAEDAKHNPHLVPDPGYLCGEAAEIVFNYAAGEECRLHSAYFLWIDPVVYPAQIGLITTLRFLCEPLNGGPITSAYLDRSVAPQPGPLTTLMPIPPRPTPPPPTCAATPFGCFPMLPPNGQIEDPWAQ